MERRFALATHPAILFFFFVFCAFRAPIYADALDGFISLKTFCSISNHAPQLPQEFDPGQLHAGEIFYLRHSHAGFFQQVHPRISVPYILITHGNPCEFPGPFAAYLEDPKLIVWFAQNLPKEHSSKIQPIPLGISPNEKRAEILERERKKEWKKTIFLYANFLTDTCPEEREPLMQRFINEPFCVVKTRVGFEEYLQDLGSAHFVLCPRGVALDSFRTWEALYMRAIPVVKSSSLDPIFEDLPVLIVQDWEEVNEAFLVAKLQEMGCRNYRLEKLTPAYWIEKINRSTYCR